MYICMWIYLTFIISLHFSAFCCFLRFFYIAGSLLLSFLLLHPLRLCGSCLTITIVVAAYTRNAKACQKVLTLQSSFARVEALVRLTMTTLANKKKSIYIKAKKWAGTYTNYNQSHCRTMRILLHSKFLFVHTSFVKDIILIILIWM